MDSATDTAEFYRRNLDFHAEIAVLCGNQVLGAIYRHLLELVRSHHPRLQLLPGRTRTLCTKHGWRSIRRSPTRSWREMSSAARAAAEAHSLHDPAVASVET